jgi:hypothetical protein
MHLRVAHLRVTFALTDLTRKLGVCLLLSAFGPYNDSAEGNGVRQLGEARPTASL